MKHSLDSVDKAEVKRIISAAIKLFHREHPGEAAAFYEYVRQRKAGLHNDMGAVIDGDHAIERALFEMPVGVYDVLMKNMTPEQLVWFATKEASRWFATTFPKYSLIDKENV